MVGVLRHWLKRLFGSPFGISLIVFPLIFGYYHLIPEFDNAPLPLLTDSVLSTFLLSVGVACVWYAIPKIPQWLESIRNVYAKSSGPRLKQLYFNLLDSGVKSGGNNYFVAVANLEKSRHYDFAARLNFLVLLLLLLATGFFMIFAGTVARLDFGALKKSTMLATQIGELRQPIRDRYIQLRADLSNEIKDLRSSEDRIRFDADRRVLVIQDNGSREVRSPSDSETISDLQRQLDVRTKEELDEFRNQRADTQKKLSLLDAAEENGLKSDPMLTILTKQYGIALDIEVLNADALERTSPFQYAMLIRLSVLLISIYLSIILINLYKYNSKLSGIHSARALAVLAELTSTRDFMERVASLTSEHLEVGRPPRHPVEYVTQLMETGFNWLTKGKDIDQEPATTPKAPKVQAKPRKRN